MIQSGRDLICQQTETQNTEAVNNFTYLETQLSGENEEEVEI
jgi:hypothetical protein